jgi:hypothetical protein
MTIRNPKAMYLTGGKLLASQTGCVVRDETKSSRGRTGRCMIYKSRSGDSTPCVSRSHVIRRSKSAFLRLVMISLEAIESMFVGMSEEECSIEGAQFIV